ncbi:hypothetical protein AAVH_30957 [Aphelenchoides avenae]|nr:hypothetical protein AAVH_30957 [Aphelenchus avenae]
MLPAISAQLISLSLVVLLPPAARAYIAGGNDYNTAYADWYRQYYNYYYGQQAAAAQQQQQQAAAAQQQAADPFAADHKYTCITAPPAAYNLCTWESHAFMPLKEVFKDNPLIMAILGR